MKFLILPLLLFIFSCSFHKYGFGEDINEFSQTMKEMGYIEITKTIPPTKYSKSEYKAKHFKDKSNQSYISVLYNENTHEVYSITEGESLDQLKLGAVHFESTLKNNEKK